MVTDFYSVPNNPDISSIADFEHATDPLSKIVMSYCTDHYYVRLNGITLYLGQAYEENMFFGNCEESREVPTRMDGGKFVHQMVVKYENNLVDSVSF